MVTQKDIDNKNRKRMPPKGNIEGVIHIAQPGQLAQEFITAGKSFEEALGRCTLRDEQQRNAVIIYKAQLDLFEMADEINDLTNWLNGSSAIGGFNKSLSAMVGTGIYVPEGAGIKMSKENQKALMEMQKQRSMNNNQQVNGQDNGQQQ